MGDLSACAAFSCVAEAVTKIDGVCSAVQEVHKWMHEDKVDAQSLVDSFPSLHAVVKMAEHVLYEACTDLEGLHIWMAEARDKDHYIEMMAAYGVNLLAEELSTQ